MPDISLSTKVSTKIPRLISGGLMLTWRCTNACRHCLYRCSPRWPDEWMSLETASRVFQALAREKHLDAIHIAGGEATLNLDHLVKIIEMASEYNIPLSYLETNASWCEDRQVALQGMERLKNAGLPAILVSVSMFHNEFVPFRASRNAVETATEVFGRHGVYIYLPHMYEFLAHLPDDGTHSLEQLCRYAGIDAASPEVVQTYGIIPGGRAAGALRNCYRPRPASRFRHENCLGELLNTTHFHIDPEGNLFTGLCAGIAAATPEDLHPEIQPETYPVLSILMEEGPFGLMALARREAGYTERPEGYVSKCDLCYEVRKALHATGRYEELCPAYFYTGA
jgi:hypothetical protein